MQAENVEVIDNLPPGLTLTEISLIGAGACIGSDVVTCYLGHLLPDDTITITLNVLLDPDLSVGTIVQNDASVGSDDFDPDMTNNFASVVSTIGMSADLEITKVASGKAMSGEQIIYSIDVTNHGPSDVLGARVIDLIPDGLVDVSWTCLTYRGMCSERGDGSINEFVNIPVGETLEYTLIGTISVFETVTNTARVLPPNALVDPDLSNNMASAVNQIYVMVLPLIYSNSQTRVFAPDLVVTSVSVSQASAEVTIMNAGLAPVLDPFWVDLYIDPSMPPESVNQVWANIAAQGLVWGIDSYALPINPGESITLQMGDDFYWALGSYVVLPIQTGTDIYVQVIRLRVKEILARLQKTMNFFISTTIILPGLLIQPSFLEQLRQK